MACLQKNQLSLMVKTAMHFTFAWRRMRSKPSARNPVIPARRLRRSWYYP